MNRFLFIDSAKGLLMFMVIAGHLPQVCKRLLEVDTICISIMEECNLFFISFYMPAFFVITGYCSNFDKGILDFFKTHFIKLFLPAILFGFVESAGIQAIMGGKFCFAPKSFVIETILFGTHYWFISSLLLSKLTYYVIAKRIKNQIVQFMIVLALLFLGFICNKYYSATEYWYFVHSLFLLPFILIGRIIRMKNWLNFDIYGLTLLSCIYISFLIIAFNVEEIPFVTLSIQCKSLFSLLCFFILSISGTLWLLAFVKRIQNNRLLCYIGKYSIVLYLLQISLLLIAEKISLYLFAPLDNIRSLLFIGVTFILFFAFAFPLMRVYNTFQKHIISLIA